MKTLNKLKVILILFSLFSISIISFSQISTIIPDRGFGDNQNNVVSTWINSGADLINQESINVSVMIDVTEHGVLPNSGPVGEAINDLLYEHFRHNDPLTIFYFPMGVYHINETLKIPSNVILKGETGAIADEHDVTLFSFNTSGVCISFLLSGPTENSGIEDIGISDIFDPDPTDFYNNGKKNSDSSKDDFKDTIQIPAIANNCWIRGVEIFKTRRMHINVYGVHNTISGCYFHDGWDYGDDGHAYGVCLSGTPAIGEYGSHFNRVEDNVFKHLRHSMVFQYNPQQNVMAYNYSLDSYGTKTFLGITYEIDVADLLFHSKKDSENGPSYNLCEGNIAEWIRFDKGGELPGLENGPYNTIFRCKAVDSKVGSIGGGEDHQYKQNFVGCDALPDTDTRDFINDYGYSRYWNVNPNWSQTPSDSCSYYIDIPYGNKPDFFVFDGPNFNWPFMPNENNPAKYRYERNHNQHLQYPHLFEAIHIGWDDYPNFCGPYYYYFIDNSIVSNLEEEYLAMNKIEAGPYELLSNNSIYYKCEDQIILKPGFKVNASNNNYFHAKSDDFCNTEHYHDQQLNSNSEDFLIDLYESKLDKSIIENFVISNQDNTAVVHSDIIKIGPNPNNGIFTVYLPFKKSPVYYQIIDIDGKLIVYDIASEYNFTINIKNQPKGMYILKIIANNIVYNYKIFYQ